MWISSGEVQSSGLPSLLIVVHGAQQHHGIALNCQDSEVNTTFCTFLLVPINLTLSPKQPFYSLIFPLLLRYLPFPCLVLFIHSSTFTLVPPFWFLSHFLIFPLLPVLSPFHFFTPLPYSSVPHSCASLHFSFNLYSGTPTACVPSNFFILPQLIWCLLPVPLFMFPPPPS